MKSVFSLKISCHGSFVDFHNLNFTVSPILSICVKNVYENIFVVNMTLTSVFLKYQICKADFLLNLNTYCMMLFNISRVDLCPCNNLFFQINRCQTCAEKHWERLKNTIVLFGYRKCVLIFRMSIWSLRGMLSLVPRNKYDVLLGCFVLNFAIWKTAIPLIIWHFISTFSSVG